MVNWVLLENICYSAVSRNVVFAAELVVTSRYQRKGLVWQYLPEDICPNIVFGRELMVIMATKVSCSWSRDGRDGLSLSCRARLGWVGGGVADMIFVKPSTRPAF